MARSANGEGSIRVRKDGRFEARLQVNGRRISVFGTSRQEVLTKLNQLKREALLTASLPGSQTLADLFDAWLAAGTWKAHTRLDYQQQIGVIQRELGPSLKLRKLTPQRIQAFLTNHRSAPRMSQVYYQRLHTALGQAVRWGWLSSNPADRIIKPRHQAAPKEVWSDMEVRRFLTKAGRWKALWYVAATTGARIGELRALTWDDVDLITGTISIKRTVQEIAWKTVVSTPKTRSGIRAVSIPGQVISLLLHWKAKQEAELRAAGLVNEAGWVWTTRSGKHVTYNGLRCSFVHDRERAGVEGTIHTLRHQHASMLLSAGLPLPEVAQRLGHANGGITMSIYAHMIPGSDRAADIASKLLEDC